MYKESKNQGDRGIASYLGEISPEPYAFAKIAVPYIKVLFSGVPLEERANVIRQLQNLTYSPHINGILVPDVDLSTMRLGDVLKLWNAYQSLLLATLAGSTRDELFNKFGKWFKAFGGQLLPEDVLKNIIENTDYSELVPTQGDLFPTFYDNFYDPLDDVMLNPDYIVGLDVLSSGQSSDIGLKSLYDAMQGDIARLEGKGFLKKVLAKIAPKVAQNLAIRKEIKQEARNTGVPVRQAVQLVKAAIKADPTIKSAPPLAILRELVSAPIPVTNNRVQPISRAAAIDVGLPPSVVSPTNLVIASAPVTDTDAVNRVMDMAKIGQAVRNLGAEERAANIEALATKLPSDVLEKITDHIVDGPDLPQDVIESDQIYAYKVAGVGIMVTPEPLRDDLVATLGASLLTGGDKDNELLALHDVLDVEAPIAEGDLAVPDLLMMGHKISAAQRLGLYHSGGVGNAPIAIDRGLTPSRSNSSSPTSPLFQAGDIRIGDMLYTACLRQMKDDVRLDNAGDIQYEGFIPVLAAAALPAAKFIGKGLMKTSVGKAIGAAAKKGASKIGSKIKGVFTKKGLKRAGAGLAGAAALEVGTDAALSAIKQSKNERAANKVGGEGLTKYSNIEEGSDVIGIPAIEEDQVIDQPADSMYVNTPDSLSLADDAGRFIMS